MSRKKFVESHGATCQNWTWSWSFINERERVIIFGAWDNWADQTGTVIFDEAWDRSSTGRKNAAYQQSREHIRLIESDGYALKTFPIKYSDELKDKYGNGPSRIAGFGRELTSRRLKRAGSKWYAVDDVIGSLLPEEVESQLRYSEGTSTRVVVNAYERSAEARAECIRHYGAKCVVCAFDFRVAYGEIGAGVIHVHHLIPLADIKRAYKVDPVKDLRPVCPNCHAIIHIARPALTIERLKSILRRK